MITFPERLALAALRRFAPNRSDDFVRHALYIASRPLVARQLDRLAKGAGVVAVQAGPFAGLKMLRNSSGTGHIAKLLGTYEMQLTPWVERLVAARPAAVINIGCGDGYYLSGMAVRLPQARCVGFDSDAGARREAEETARLNGVAERVSVRGECTAAALNEVLAPGACVIVDCEGAELMLLDPARSPLLLQATMLVELHEAQAPGVTDALRQRFAASHAIETLGQSLTLPPSLSEMPEILQLALLCEHRGEAQQWMLLLPRRA